MAPGARELRRPDPAKGKAECECGRPLPVRELDGVSCVKCGHAITREKETVDAGV